MPKFTYTAIDAATGKDRKGVIEAASSEQATIELKAKGLLPTQIMGEGNAGAFKLGPKKTTKHNAGSGADVKSWLNVGGAAQGGKKKKQAFVIGKIINQKGLTLFTRQLATLINAGMPILRSLETLARQEKNIPFKNVVEDVAETIRSGGTFSDGLLQNPKVFDRLYVNMVKAGEAGGVLGTVLDRLAKFMEKAMKIKGKVKSAMTYPIIILFVAVAIVSALMVFVIPKFQEIFDGLLKGQPLPDITRLVLGVSNFVKDHFIITLILVIGGWIGFKMFKKTKFGISLIDKILIKTPAVGPLFLKASVGRFTRTLGTLLSSGVPILQALLITRDTSGNVHVANALNAVHDRVKEGDSVGKPLEATRIFPTMVSSMVEVGEETGALPDMLNRIADVYDDEVDNAVASVTSIIEPVMIVFLAVIVGTIVIAMFMPLIKIIQSLS
ncbi:type II secretion system F family protein [Opitutaceae bacterium TAV4]|uniref:type II secretion system F family protein n=1 Tax=Geminisphaera colitermitum TaxID=1148786 RepID=UPI000158D23E|nr:type II secretion system F family protein [Geminisphaera colitermitum]RRJ95567.1 type II secretion system F family protein [Opitutaceae bacterium TAV4]RRJ99871.1 type II secretion system F family protein [Opitutaceae bacterium TAV3]